MMPGWRLYVFSALILLPIGLVSCGWSALPKTYPASGSVVYQGGKPIRGGGSIQFVSADDPALRIVGDIRPNGSFVLRTVKDSEQSPGAPVGEYDVTIHPAPAAGVRGAEAGGQRAVEPIAATRKQKIHAGENQMKIEIPLPPPS
jgi:hypothetical protein